MAYVVAFRGSSRSFIVQTVREAVNLNSKQRRSGFSSWCNTEAQRHHERTCIDMDVVVVQAAFPHIFDQQVFRKGLILDIGVCIMEEK